MEKFKFSLHNIDGITDDDDSKDATSIDHFFTTDVHAYVGNEFNSTAYRVKVKKLWRNQALVHYMGWNRRYDEWVDIGSLLTPPKGESVSKAQVNEKNTIDLSTLKLQPLYAMSIVNEKKNGNPEKDASNDIDPERDASNDMNLERDASNDMNPERDASNDIDAERDASNDIGPERDASNDMNLERDASNDMNLERDASNDMNPEGDDSNDIDPEILYYVYESSSIIGKCLFLLSILIAEKNFVGYAPLVTLNNI